MGLLPIEFTDCLSDSPYFRENLHAHERELELTSQQIKELLRNVKELLSAATALSRAQRNVANSLTNFKFECIGGSQTDDEIVIARSLQEFGRFLNTIEDERDRMLDRASTTFIQPIENFRSNHIGLVKAEKKKFEKETAKFCNSLERHLNLSTKKSENHLQEADANLEFEQLHFTKESLKYVCKLQEVQERKKFEFVETILSFMYGWLTFYHQGHETANDFKSFMRQLQIRLQRTRENYEATQNETKNLMNKIVEIRNVKPQDPGSLNKMYAREGYLFLMEKKAFGTTWIKTFCQYQKECRRFTMIPYSQTVGKIGNKETVTLKECIRRMSDSIDKRFCFDVIPVDKPAYTYTFQALSEEDRKLWLDAMDGKDPIQLGATNGSNKSSTNAKQEEYQLDDLGFAFVRKCIQVIESRGLEDQGLYRIGGVNSKVAKLMQMALDRRKLSSDGELELDVDNSDEMEIRTVTSALKNYFRNLPEPLMSFKFHNLFIAAAKQENREKRIDDVHDLIHRLPKSNFDMLHLLIQHLSNVANNSEKNLMNVCNLGVCFGPTLLRPEEETVAAIMDIKFGNVVVEILIENCDKIFNTKPIEGRTLGPFFPAGPSSSSIACPSSEVDNDRSSLYMKLPLGNHDSSFNSQATYATIPIRSGLPVNPVNHVYRSGSHEQLSQNQYKVVNRSPHQHYPSTHGMNVIAYPTHSNMYQASNRGLPPPPPPPHPNGPPINRPVRPLAVFNPWNSQPSIMGHSLENNPLKPKLEGRNHRSNVSMVGPQPQSNTPRSSPSSNTIISSSFNPYGIEPEQSQSFNSNRSSSNTGSSPSSNNGQGRRVRTLYACVGENASELTFEPNTLIFNVRPSHEPGWLEGCYKGRVGLIPENYVQYVD
ncbi:GTPase regulator associated with FAK isoform X2 [Brevipalpus obovatus]|uniref:GTPase regulator associated with FAK isoform X2 n=1 Tax=Brevipalpus obovatus TaxID=246614 RepID=UPI003D9F5D3D